MAPKAEEKDRNFVTALARGLEILRCFRDGESALCNTEFAERTGLPKATVSRLTHTLCRLGYLAADAQSGSYRLSTGVLELGFAALSGVDVAARAAAPMRALRDGPNSYVTVALGEAHRADAVYVAVERSRESVALTMRIGSRLPLFDSAMGRAILAAMDDDERAAACEAARRDDPGSETARGETLERARREWSERGYCTSYGDWRSDVNGIAVALRVPGDTRLYGLNVGGPSFHVRRRQLETVYAPRLLEAARALSLSA